MEQYVHIFVQRRMLADIKEERANSHTMEMSMLIIDLRTQPSRTCAKEPNNHTFGIRKTELNEEDTIGLIWTCCKRQLRVGCRENSTIKPDRETTL